MGFKLRNISCIRRFSKFPLNLSTGISCCRNFTICRRRGCNRTLRLEASARACKLSQHLLEIRLTETSTCYMTERTGGGPEYWQQYRAVPRYSPRWYNTVHSSTHRGRLVRHTVICKTTTLTLQNTRIQKKAFRGCGRFTGHAPSRMTGAGLQLQPPLIGLSRATAAKKHRF